MSRDETYSELDSLDLALQLPSLVGSDRGTDDGPADATSAAESRLGGHKDVRHVLVFAEKGKVEDDFDGLNVRGHDDELADTTVERLGGLVGALLELLVVRGLLHQVEDLVGQRRIGEWESLWVNGGHLGC